MTAVIGGVVTGLVVLRAAFLAARLAKLAMGVGLLTGRIGLLRYAGVVGGLAGRVLPLLAGAFRLVGAGMMTGRIGLMLYAGAAGRLAGRVLPLLAGAARLVGAGMLTARIGLLRYAGAMGGLALRVLPLVVNAIRLVGLAIAANPIGLAVTAVAAIAALVIANWEPVKAFFEGVWDKVGPYFSAAWEGFKAILSWTPLGLIIKYWGPISDFFGNLFGGIGERAGAVFDWISGKISAVTETAGKVAGWLSDTFGIGGGDGEATGEKLARNVVEPAKAAAAAVVIGGTAAAASPGLPPEYGAPAGGASRIVNLAVNAAPGQDAESIAKEVMRIIDRETGAIDHE